MKVVVIGAGGVGAYLGAVLFRAGHAVTLYARGQHLASIRDQGLTVHTPDGRFVVPVRATDRVHELGDADVALVTVKGYSLAEVAPAVRVVAERGADVVPLLNGVTAVDDLVAAGVPAARLLGGLARISAVRTGPGVVERRSTFQVVVVGEMAGGPSDRAARVAAALRDAGVDAQASEHIEIELWQKFVFISAMAAVCGLARTSIGPVRAAPGGARLVARAVAEVVTVARARGIALPADEAHRTTDYIMSLPDGMKPSFLLDLEAGGRTELDTLSGAVVRFASELGVECPVHETALATLSVAQRA